MGLVSNTKRHRWRERSVRAGRSAAAERHGPPRRSWLQTRPLPRDDFCWTRSFRPDPARLAAPGRSNLQLRTPAAATSSSAAAD